MACGLTHKLNENFPSTEFVGGIFPRKHVSIIAAKAGVGKTWYLLKLFTDLSQGGTIFNTQAYYEPPRRCLLFVGETGMGLLAERVRQMYDQPDNDNIDMISRVDVISKGDDITLDSNAGYAKILDECYKVKPDIIAFDTLMSFQNGDESEQKNMVVVMRNLMNIAENTRAAVVVTHHVRKASKKEVADRITQDEIIGSSALVRLCGNAFILNKPASDIYQLTPVKAWWKLPEPTTYRMYEDTYGQVVFAQAHHEDIDFDSARNQAKRYLEAMPSGTQFTMSELMKKFQVASSTASRLAEKYGERTGEKAENGAMIYLKI